MSRRTVSVVLIALALCAGPASSALATAPAGTTDGPANAERPGVPLPGSSLPTDFLPPGGAPVPAARDDRLTITYRAEPGAKPERHSLLCRPAGGNHPVARSACDALYQKSDPFAPVPVEAVCTRIYGGPHTAQITGLWHGKPVNASFERSGGCEIARWDALVPALPSIR